jgi:hypothetical protein
MLSQEQIAYGQQKNREHIWQECKEMFIKYFERTPYERRDEDQECLDLWYEAKCKRANITPW